MFMLFQREHYKDIIKAAKQRAKLLALKALRRSNPNPPMVSRLDIEKLTSSSEDEGQQEEGEGTSSNKCGQCSHLKERVRKLETMLKPPSETPSTSSLPYISPDTGTPTRKKYERKTVFFGSTSSLGMYK